MKDVWINYDTGEMRNDMISLEEFKKKHDQKERKLNGYRYAKREILPLPAFLQEEYGNFINTRYLSLLDKLDYDTATAFRFIYLCTFMNYNDGHVVWKGRVVDDSYLADIFNVNKNTIIKIKTKLYENELIYKDSKGYIYINNNYCYRGDISDNPIYKQQYTRIFNNSIRELYNKSSDSREHKMLGKFILLLPYINVYHNIICLNIKERDIDKLVVPNSVQMDEILHTSSRNYMRQMNELLDIMVGGEPAVLVINHKNVRMYAVNPRIYYGGTKLSDVETLSGYFRAKGGLD